MGTAAGRAIIFVLKKAIEDEEARKVLMYILMIPVVIFILLLSAIEYMFNMPIDDMFNIFGDSWVLIHDAASDFGYFQIDENAFLDFDFSSADPVEAEAFQKLMAEATKYIGWPYVWGGRSPRTSFDCSGFTQWAYTQSGVADVYGVAQTQYNNSIKIPASEAKAGDLIFFKGTYKPEDGRIVTHVGIYVGNGKMLHAGSPIGYASINTKYWKAHFYSFGRVLRNN